MLEDPYNFYMDLSHEKRICIDNYIYILSIINQFNGEKTDHAFYYPYELDRDDRGRRMIFPPSPQTQKT